MYIFVFFFPWVRRLHTARSRSRYVFIMCLYRHLPSPPFPPPRLPLKPRFVSSPQSCSTGAVRSR